MIKGAEQHAAKNLSHFFKPSDNYMIRFDPHVIVKSNKKVFATEQILCEWIIEMLEPLLPTGPCVLASHIAWFQTTDAALDCLRPDNILPTVIPSGGTGSVQPSHTSINKLPRH